MARRAGGYRVFLKQFFERYHTTGAILPSGPRLAGALCRYLSEGLPPRQILEVGPGTGPATAQIVKRMLPHDRLTLVELNDAFVKHLHARFDSEPDFKQVVDQCQIVHDRLENLPGEHCYDVIISGLPLNNFSVEVVDSLLVMYERLLKPGGVVSFFEYIAIRRAKSAVCGSNDRDRLRGIGRSLHKFLDGREIRRESVLLNIPPAWVHHVRIGQAGARSG